MSKKILLFSGSTSENSINAKLLNFCQQHMLENITSTWVDIIDYPLPEYSIDLENTEGIPSYAKAFKALLKSHDGIIISCPEHNGLPPVAFKNLVDWMSRLDGSIFEDKPLLLLSTSPGERGGKNVLTVLENLLPFWGARLFNTFSFPSFYENFDLEQNIVLNTDLKAQLSTMIDQFSDTIIQSGSEASVTTRGIN